VLSERKALVWHDAAPGRFALYEGSAVTEIASPRICSHGELQGAWFVCGLSAGQIELLAVDAHQVAFISAGIPSDATASAVVWQR
jgi:hypothetical protein